jgi:hypothetical protein
MTAVFLMMAADIFMAGGVLIAERGASVGGTVVHQYDLVVHSFLFQDTVQTDGEVRFGVVYGYDDAE